MKKLELLSRIQNLASLLHCDDLKQYNLTTESVKEMHRAMDALTEEYIACYC
jgi:Glu-tRNA(Gln) amidotransferase subunit E-like FAD-binding protein